MTTTNRKWAVLAPNPPTWWDRCDVLKFEVDKITPKQIWAKRIGYSASRYTKSEYVIELFDDETVAQERHIALNKSLGIYARDDAKNKWDVAAKTANDLMRAHVTDTPEQIIPTTWSPTAKDTDK